MLLIRPLLRANESRERKVHIVVFFIFIVSNGAGMLTPLGDPPLFLGFLRGVPFLWTFKLIGPWALVNGVLLVLFNLFDQRVLAREERERPGSQLEEAMVVEEPLRIEGAVNFLWLAGVIAVISVMGRFGTQITSSEDVRALLQIGGMAAMAVLSLITTAKAHRGANQFAWSPILEVAALFLGIFVTMVPALKILEIEGRRPRRDRALAVLLGERPALELPRQRAHLPHVRVARGRRRQRSRPRRRLERRPPRRAWRTTRSVAPF